MRGYKNQLQVMRVKSKRRVMAVLALLGFMNTAIADAHAQITVTGSHAVEYFARYVGDEFSKETPFPSPVFSTEGSEAGIKLLLDGDQKMHTDIVMSSRKIDPSELEGAKLKGVNDIIELGVGKDAIVLVNAKTGLPFRLTSQDLFLALAEQVPLNGRLVKNPYLTWNQIRATLPKQPILIYGPGATSGMRHVINEKVLQPVAERIGEYEYYAGKSIVIRQDGAYITIDDHEKNLLARVVTRKNALAIIPFGLYTKHSATLQCASVDGITPLYTTISSGKYPLSRDLYLYVSGFHIAEVKGLRDYVDLFLSEDMIGDSGHLHDMGFIPLPKKDRLMLRMEWLKTSRALSDFIFGGAPEGFILSVLACRGFEDNTGTFPERFVLKIGGV